MTNLFRNGKSILFNIIVMIFSLSCISPMIWLIYSSFKTKKEFNNNIMSFPNKIQFENYIDAFRTSHMGTYSLNSFFNASVSLFFTLLFSFFIGYFISRYKFIGRRLIYVLFMFGMLVPVHALLVPIFIQFNEIGLINNRLTLIIPYIAFSMPFSIFLIESFIKGIPRQLEEAAVIDGASLFCIMTKIIMPVCRPILITVGILSFFSRWNEFSFALVLISDESLKTIPLGLKNFSGQFNTDYPKQMAAIVMATLPIIIIYLISNQKIIEGMTQGSVKG